MKTSSIVSLIAFLMSATSSAAVDAEDSIIYSDTAIDFYRGSNDKQHIGSKVEAFMATVNRINLSIGTFDQETFEPVDISNSNKTSLKNMVIALVEKTPTAVNFSNEEIEDGALAWVREVTHSGGKNLINVDYEDKFISNIPLSKEAQLEWTQSTQMPTKYTFRLGVLTQSVKNQVNGVLGEGFDMNHRCSTGTYHKLFFEIVAAETISGKEFNYIVASKTRFFLNMPAKDRRNLFLGKTVSMDAPVNATEQQLQALCNELL